MSNLKACNFPGCKYSANKSGYCPRHELLISYKGLESVLTETFGPACELCGERSLESVLTDCPTCNRKNVCEECRDAEACCMGMEDE